jgi:hypothetical protein
MNVYGEVTESRRGRTVLAAYGTPGLALFGTIAGATGGCRGNGLITTNDGRCYAAVGSGLYEVYSDGTSALLGSLNTSSGPVSMAENGTTLVVVDGSYGYTLTLSTQAFARITSDAFYGADKVAFLDNYLVFNRPNTQQFYLSNLAAVTFDALDFATAEGAPDRLLSLIVHNRQLLLLGQTSTEFWFDVGDPLFPLARNPSAFLETGIVAPHSVAKSQDTVVWLDGDERGNGIVWALQGYTPQRVSTFPVEYALGQYSTLSDAIGFCVELSGHTWYCLSFPTANATWVYDMTQGLWFELGYLNPTTGSLERHRMNAHAFAFGKHLLGDYANGNVYVWDFGTYTDNTAAIRREIQWPPLFEANSLHRVIHTRFQADIEAGVGLDANASPGSDPQLMLSWSNDGGHTWSSEHWTSAGRLGEYSARAQWWRLGSGRDRRYKLAFSDPCKFVLLNAYVDVEGSGA